MFEKINKKRVKNIDVKENRTNRNGADSRLNRIGSMDYYIKHNPKPVSLTIVADSESGKTELLKKYRNNNGVHVERRFSAYGIQRDLIEGKINVLFSKPKILGHILVYDLSSIYSFKQNTVDSTIAFLDALTEEALSSESTYAMESDALKKYEGLKGGIIAAINTQGFFTPKRKKNITINMKKGGFFSRNILVSYGISEMLLQEIFDSIRHQRYKENKDFTNLIAIDFPTEKRNVLIPMKHMYDIEEIRDDIRQELLEDLGETVKGIRLEKSLIPLAQASALRNNRKITNSEDIERLRHSAGFSLGFSVRYSRRHFWSVQEK
jgi:hypothetical protein